MNFFNKIFNKFIIAILLCIIIIVSFIGSTNVHKYKETYTNRHKNALCLLTREPNKIWMEFLTTFVDSYDVFIVIDNQEDYTNLAKQYPNITLVQIPDEVCHQHGYINSDLVFKPVVATDRAFYYFNRVNTEYENIWFCEDDVFIQEKDVLVDLDKQYPLADFIVPRVQINEDGSDDGWPHWRYIDNLLPLPWAHYIICLTRISKRLMQKVDEFVKEHGRQIYKEILFHTLAIHNDMEIKTPAELKNITWNDPLSHELAVQVQKKEITIFHPIKDLNHHIQLRG